MERLLSDKTSGENITVKVGNAIIGGKKKILISGPCSVENMDLMMEIGTNLKRIGVDILRGGAFKPRTSPYDFQGLKYEGLKILSEVGKENNLPVVTEVMDVRDIDIVLKNCQMIQIGSRNMFNYSLLKEVGKIKDVPVLLKRGMSSTLREWICAAEYIMYQGNSNVVLCERGIRTFESFTRNTLDLSIVASIKQKYRIPIIVDPSHGTGLSELVPQMSIASLCSGADGLMIESHINPEKSISDARQTISIESMEKITCLIKKYESLLCGLNSLVHNEE